VDFYHYWVAVHTLPKRLCSNASKSEFLLHASLHHNKSCTIPYLSRLPSEIILKICSFLDAFSLLNIGFVNKRFHDLANSKCVHDKEFE